MNCRILLTGKTGQVGSELLHLLPRIGEVVAPDRHEMDMLNADTIRRVVREIQPELIINAAAYTAVDAAEAREAESYAMNASAPAILAEEAKRLGAAIVHYSTDYVFDGVKRSPYDEADLPCPINVYGKTKLAGEQAIVASGIPYLIFRTAWVYSAKGRNFPLTILRLGTQKEILRIVSDQFGAPTWSRAIAGGTVRVLTQLMKLRSPSGSLSQTSGIYHLTAKGQTTWYDFARAILEEAGKIASDVPWFADATNQRPMIVREIIPITAQQYPTPASRPAFSVLSNSRLARTFGIELPEWRMQLRDMFGDRALSLAAVSAE